jgi:hypothetical protein
LLLLDLFLSVVSCCVKFSSFDGNVTLEICDMRWIIVCVSCFLLLMVGNLMKSKFGNLFIFSYSLLLTWQIKVNCHFSKKLDLIKFFTGNLKKKLQGVMQNWPSYLAGGKSLLTLFLIAKNLLIKSLHKTIKTDKNGINNEGVIYMWNTEHKYQNKIT